MNKVIEVSKMLIVDNFEKHIRILFTAELQFRLASAVRIACSLGTHSLDLPKQWTFGQHIVEYDEIALRPDQADYASHFLEQSATFLLATSIRDAIREVFDNPKDSNDDKIRSAYQIARLIRNAFAYSPFAPKWSIDADCQNKIFEIPDVITLNTKDLHQKTVTWGDYGGILAMFRFARFVRIQILGDQPAPRKVVPPSTSDIFVYGDLILKKIDEVPSDAVPVELERLPDGGIHLGDGYVIYETPNEEQIKGES